MELLSNEIEPGESNEVEKNETYTASYCERQLQQHTVVHRFCIGVLWQCK